MKDSMLNYFSNFLYIQEASVKSAKKTFAIVMSGHPRIIWGRLKIRWVGKSVRSGFLLLIS